MTFLAWSEGLKGWWMIDWIREITMEMNEDVGQSEK